MACFGHLVAIEDSLSVRNCLFCAVLCCAIMCYAALAWVWLNTGNFRQTSSSSTSSASIYINCTSEIDLKAEKGDIHCHQECF